jgi:Domain of unknown function (DUF5597)/Beta-galactosidase
MKVKHIVLSALLTAAALGAQHAAPLPVIKQNGALKQLFVDNRPFIMLSGEMRNSTASSVEYMKPVWDNLAALHLNTVIGTVSWELIEPEEGHFDFRLVDAQIHEARRRNMRLVLIWFGTYKTAHSSYVPHWVKADRKRFPPMVLERQPDRPTLFPLGALTVGEGGIGALTPFGEETLKADSNAFRALMRHLREFDARHTVIMMQVENEPGSFGDSRDRSPLSQAAWAQPVPRELMNYITCHRRAEPQRLRARLQGNVRTIQPRWKSSADSGNRPSARQSILGRRPSCRAGMVPFGAVEGLKPDGQLGNSYKILSSVMPQLTKWQAEGKVDAILAVDGEDPKPLSLGGYKISLVRPRESMPAPGPTAASQTPGQSPTGGTQPVSGPASSEPPSADKRPFAIVVNTAPDEFLFIGGNGVPAFSVDSPGPAHVAVASKNEGRYEDGKWVAGRRLNGDEVGQGLPDGGVGMLKIKLIRFD